MDSYRPELPSGERVICAMSGGVDSSVAAALLKRQGYEVIGLFMRSGVSGAATTGEKQGCCSVEDSMDARRVADALDIPFYALNMSEQFDAVIGDFVASYERGETPNPCVQCNRLLKFGYLLEFAEKVGAKAVATGHYARVVRHAGGRLGLARPDDAAKDQTYVLFVLSQYQLAHTLLPLGHYEKPEVRRMAREFGFERVAGKRDSVEICFVAKDYRDFLEPRIATPRAGRFVDTSGRALGRHEGIHRFTVGQRRKLGLSVGRPLYVVGIDPSSADVIVGDEADLLSSRLEARRAQWSGMAPPSAGEERRVRAQVRYNHTPQAATLRGLGGDGFELDFDEPERAVTPGQAVVLYDEEDRYVLGGGWITRPTLEV
jgi:tRNA-uridine 2-sulfurtransferase